MKKIIQVPGIGFCLGVKRAVQIALAAAEKEPVETLGPLMHNAQAMQALSDRIHVVENLAEVKGSRVIIRSHGVPPVIFAEAEERGIEVIDATCPFVKKAQMTALRLTEQGYQVIIVGNPNHPEVIGLSGWCGNQALVVQNCDELPASGTYSKLALIAQTTQREDVFQACVAAAKALAPEVVAVNTICHHTMDLQKATAAVAKQVDLMAVIGGKNSSNTKKLAQISSEFTKVALIETALDLDIDIVRGSQRIGITAGASTPEHIIEEVLTRMVELEKMETQVVPEENVAEENEVDAFAAEYGDMKEIRRGARVKGTVVQVKDDELLVDIGGKSEGVLSSSELTADDAKNIHERFHVGDEIDVLILRKENQEGYPVLSKRRVDQDIAWDKLAQLKQEKAVITGTVTDVVKGGVLVDVGLRGFVPASLVSLGYVEDLSSFVGKELQMKIIECDKHSNKLVLSAKAVLRKASQALKEQTWAEIAEGQTRKGVVRRLTNFGAFVDIGGVDGLLHVSEMAWYRVNQPSDLLKEGDEIEVYILGVDAENEKISLGMKQLIPNPWSQAKEKYPEGCVIPAKVMRTTDFGAFLEVEPGVEGLVHISQMANHRVEKTEDVVKPGDVVNVKVISVDPEAKRMSLSIKATLPPEETAEEAPAAEAPAEEAPVEE